MPWRVPADVGWRPPAAVPVHEADHRCFERSPACSPLSRSPWRPRPSTWHGCCSHDWRHDPSIAFRHHDAARRSESHSEFHAAGPTRRRPHVRRHETRLEDSRGDGDSQGRLLRSSSRAAIGPIYPADAGLLRVHDHREDQARPGAGDPRLRQERSRTPIAGLPDVLALLKLHYLRWVLFDIGSGTYFMYQGIFDTDFDKYTEDAVALFTEYGHHAPSSRTSRASRTTGRRTRRRSIEFVREHQCPSFLEYGEYPYVTADEIKKALRAQAGVLPACSTRCSERCRTATCSNSTTSSTSCSPARRRWRRATSS